MIPLAPCRACARHVRAGSDRCPFCDQRAPTAPARAPTASLGGLSRGALVALALAGCSSDRSDGTIAQPYGAPPSYPDEPFRWKVTPSIGTLTMAQRSTFRLRVSVDNVGPTPVNPSTDPITFTVNGTPSPATDLAFANGSKGGGWFQLAPGATVSDEREVGTALFDRPGSYEVQLLHSGKVVDRVTVVVTE